MNKYIITTLLIFLGHANLFASLSYEFKFHTFNSFEAIWFLLLSLIQQRGKRKYTGYMLIDWPQMERRFRILTKQQFRRFRLTSFLPRILRK